MYSILSVTFWCCFEVTDMPNINRIKKPKLHLVVSEAIIFLSSTIHLLKHSAFLTCLLCWNTVILHKYIMYSCISNTLVCSLPGSAHQSQTPYKALFKEDRKKYYQTKTRCRKSVKRMVQPRWKKQFENLLSWNHWMSTGKEGQSIPSCAATALYWSLMSRKGDRQLVF